MADVKIRVTAEDQASRELGKVSDGLKDIQTNSGEAGKSGEKMGIDWSMALIGINQGLEIARKAVEAFKQVIDFTREGAAINRMMDTSDQLATAMGGNMDDIILAVRKATLSTVSDIEIMQATSRAMMLGITNDTDDLTKLWEVSAFRARAMGQTTAEAFGRISNAIASGHVMTLRNQGIMLDTKEVYDDFAESVGKTAAELTEQEKAQARLNAVINSTMPLIESMGGLQMDQMVYWERLDTSQDNYFKNLKRNTADSMTWWARAWDSFFTEANKEYDALRLVADLVADGLIDESAIDNVRGVIKYGLNEDLDELLNRLHEIRDAAMDAGEAAEFARRMTDPYSESLEYAAEAASRLTEGSEAITDATNNANDAMRTYTETLLFKMAAEGLSSEQALALAESMGLVDQRTLYATGKINEWQEMLLAGMMTPEEYAEKVALLADNMDRIESKDVRISVSWAEYGRISQAATMLIGGGGTGANISVPVVPRAAGGMVSAAAGAMRQAPYWVGEVGPEPFFPAQDGRILSNSQAMSAMRSGGGGGNTVVNVTIHTAVNMADRAFVEQELAPVIEDVLRRRRN